MGRFQLVVTTCDLPALQDAMVTLTAGFGQKRTVQIS
jgi:hypothetical protein